MRSTHPRHTGGPAARKSGDTPRERFRARLDTRGPRARHPAGGRIPAHRQSSRARRGDRGAGDQETRGTIDSAVGPGASCLEESGRVGQGSVPRLDRSPLLGGVMYLVTWWSGSRRTESLREAFHLARRQAREARWVRNDHLHPSAALWRVRTNGAGREAGEVIATVVPSGFFLTRWWNRER